MVIEGVTDAPVELRVCGVGVVGFCGFDLYNRTSVLFVWCSEYRGFPPGRLLREEGHGGVTCRYLGRREPGGQILWFKE